jgi:hypothetical protein
MKIYEGFSESDLNIIRFAIHKLDIKGSEAVTIAVILEKIEKEISLIQLKNHNENPQS